MHMSIAMLTTTVLVLAALSAALAVPRTRTWLIGASHLRLALVPAATAGMLWATTQGAEVVVGSVAENIAPGDLLTVYVQSIDFGVPLIQATFKDHDVSATELKRLLGPLRDLDQDVPLTTEEFNRLNSIAKPSGMIDTLNSNRSPSTKDLARLVTPVVAFYFNYVDWAKTSGQWAAALESTKGRADASVRLTSFVDSLSDTPTGAGLFQALVGMAERRALTIPHEPVDCAPEPLDIVHLEQMEGSYFLDFPTFRSLIVQNDDSPGRIQAGKDLAALFESACLDALATVLGEGAAIFKKEAALMDSYVSELNRILATKAPESIRVGVVLTNPGRFDSFVRTSARVVVGPKRSKEPLAFTVTAQPVSGSSDDGDGESPADSNYIQIGARSTKSISFTAALPSNVQTRVFGAYQSEQAYLRIGILASAGSSEVSIPSQVTPFSVRAQEAYRSRIDAIELGL